MMLAAQLMLIAAAAAFSVAGLYLLLHCRQPHTRFPRKN